MKKELKGKLSCIVWRPVIYFMISVNGFPVLCMGIGHLFAKEIFPVTSKKTKNTSYEMLNMCSHIIHVFFYSATFGHMDDSKHIHKLTVCT